VLRHGLFASCPVCIDITISTDINKKLWAKFALLASSSGVGSVTPDARKLFVDARVDSLPRLKSAVHNASGT
jgi:hypothetical protein